MTNIRQMSVLRTLQNRGVRKSQKRDSKRRVTKDRTGSQFKHIDTQCDSGPTNCAHLEVHPWGVRPGSASEPLVASQLALLACHAISC